MSEQSSATTLSVPPAPPAEVSFTHASRSWYFTLSEQSHLRSSGCVDQVVVTARQPNGEEPIEFTMSWMDSGTGLTPHVKLGIYDESFHALTVMRPLFDALADHDIPMSPEDFCALLVDLFGARDATDTEQPNTTGPTDWQIRIDHMVVGTGDETTMRAAIEALSRGRSHPAVSIPVNASGPLDLVHVEATASWHPTGD